MQNKNNIENIYPLSPTQQGILFHTLYAPKSGMYLAQISCSLSGSLNVLALKGAWQVVMERHSVLRTSFHWERRDQPFQVVYRNINLPWEQYDWQGVSPAEQQQLLKNFLQADSQRDFDLDKPPLMRLTLIQLAEDNYQFVWSKHHLILDGWSTAIVFKEVFDTNSALHQGQDLPLIRTRPYGDYIAWLRQQDLSESEAFWRRTLKGFTAPTPLRVDRNFGGSHSGQEDHDRRQIQLSQATTSALKTLAQQYQLTLNTLVQGAFALLLSRYSGESDIMFGATTSGRPPDLAEVENMVGVFINTLPVRVFVTPEEFLLPWLLKLQAQQIEAREYEYSPLVEVQAWSDVPRGMPLFESILVVENYPVDSYGAQQSENLDIREVRFVESINYPLTVLVDGGSKLSLNIWYDCQRFDAATVTRMLGHLRTLLEGMVANPNQRLKDLQLLTQAERHQLLVEWNDTQAEYQHQYIHQFEEQVKREPDAIAVVFEDQHLTYRELNHRANQLAHYLRSLGTGPEVLVGICVERSPEMLFGLLGILKAGGAYIPLDPAYPHERLAFMLLDSQVSVLVTQEKLVPALPNDINQIICLDTQWHSIAQYSNDNLQSKTNTQQLAYVIYTSGSTGQPKGVQIHHGALANFLAAMRSSFESCQRDIFLSVTTLSFDIAALELYLPLIVGARLVLVSREVATDGIELLKRLAQEGVTLMQATPTTWRILFAAGWQDNLPLKILCGGEALDRSLANQLLERGTQLWNLYGPTETTIWSSLHKVESQNNSKSEDSIVSIGRPIVNTQFYILDQYQQPVPVGVSGELYIGGAGVARGYLNRPELTALKFIPNPFNEMGLSSHLYKTGDLVRYQPNGTLEYIGRIDHQLKVRGFRIELGEIQALLSQHPVVREAVIVAREDEPGEKRIVAYVVLSSQDQNYALSPGTPVERGARGDRMCEIVPQLRSYLLEKLPKYMVPSAFVMLSALPLTPNGKVNRQALPAPDTTKSQLNEAFVTPRTVVEELLAAIWSQVLNLKQVSIHSNFFELGGHSLLATQVISRLYKTFQIELPLRCLFESPTIADLAEYIEITMKTGSGLAVPPLKPISHDGNLALSFAQKRLWLLNQLEPNNPLYNIPAAVRLTGSLNVTALRQSLNEIVRRHEVLRTRFAIVDGQPFQVVEPTLTLTLPVVDLRSTIKREAEVQNLAQEEANRPFLFTKDPLLRLVLLQLEQAEYVLLLTMHHIVSDAWSIAVLIRELGELYKAFSTKKPLPLTELPIQYADFAVWQQQWLQGETLKTQLNYWKQQLDGAPPLLQLPTDRQRPAVRTFRGATQSFILPKPLTDEIKNLSNREGVTLFMTLLAAFKTLLYCWTGQEDIIVGSPITNRTRAELEGLIGFFVNTLVLRTDLSNNPTFRELLSQVRDRTLEAYTHQHLPFEKLVEELQPERNPSYNPLFQVWFVLQNAPMPTLELPGLNITSLNINSQRAKHDLRLELVESEEGVIGSFGYRIDLFNAATIARLAENFETLLRQITTQPNTKLSNLTEILVETDRQQERIREKELEKTSQQKFQMTKRKSIIALNDLYHDT